MKILFVVNKLYASGNGLSASARRTVKALREAGEDVKVISGRNPDPDGPQPEFELDDFNFPVFDSLIRAHGYKFAKSDRRKLEEAILWADIVHLEEPFAIQYYAAKIAARHGVPVTGTYHLHPENMFCSLHMGWARLLNNLTLDAWRDAVFNKCSHLQCPTQNVKERLERKHFKSRLHVISNGLIPDECIRDVSHGHGAPYLVACIGRLAVEKDQATLFRAMRYSTHAEDIQLYFAGRGPEAERYRKAGMKLYREGILKHEPIFTFLDRDGLRELAAKADLCIHCANVEVEGLSIMEAMQQGTVPVIAEGRLSGTSQFALDERSIYPAGNAGALARRIDWWLEHPKEREQAGKSYVAAMEQYSIDRSVTALRQMFREAAAERGIPG